MCTRMRTSGQGAFTDADASKSKPQPDGTKNRNRLWRDVCCKFVFGCSIHRLIHVIELLEITDNWNPVLIRCLRQHVMTHAVRRQ